MKRPSPPEVTPDPAERAALVHAIYRIALEPRSYDVFMDHWDSHLSQSMADLAALHDGTTFCDPEIDTHFQTAFSILQELGRPVGQPQMDGEGPRVLVDGGGYVVWLNSAAATVLGIGPRSSIAQLEDHAHPPGCIARLLRELGSSNGAGSSGTASSPGIAPAILRLDLPGHTLFQIVRPVIDRDGQRLILFAPLMTGPTPEVERLLQATFRLTDAETAVAAALANGRRPEEIAARRAVSIQTVRSQIKVLLSKTGAAGQVELVRLLLAVGREVDRNGEIPTPRPVPAVFTTPGGRDMPVKGLGPSGGVPVLFLHGMLDGITPTPALSAALTRSGVRLIVPVRPGFGAAAPDKGPIETAPQRLAADLEALLDQLGLQRIAVIGHMAGAVYAFAAAAQMPERVAGIVSVAGGVPILSARQFASMSRRQRLVAYTALYAPAALPFVLRAGIRQLDFNGTRSFIAALYESSPLDAGLSSDPDVFEALQSGYEFAVAQGHGAFEIDSYHVVRDWSALVEASKVPVTLIHGHHDPVVSVASVKAFAKHLGPRATLDIRQDCGQLVLFRAPERVFATAASLSRVSFGDARTGSALGKE